MCPFESFTSHYFQQYIPENNRDLVITFFIVFSRFEYALKACRFIGGNENEAKANWDSFASSIRRQFQLDRTSELQRAINYIHNFPPRKQIKKNNQLGWYRPRTSGSPPTIFELLLYIRTIRNNLFHGAKFQEILHESDQNDRNRQLLQSALIILDECLRISPEVQQAFIAEIPLTGSSI